MSTGINIDRLHSRLRETQFHDWRFGDCLDPLEVSAHWRGSALFGAERDWQLILPIEGAQSPTRISPERADELSGLLNRALRASFENAILRTTVQLLSWRFSVLDRTNRSLTDRLERVEHMLKAIAAPPHFVQIPAGPARGGERGARLTTTEIEAITEQLKNLAATMFAESEINVDYSVENDADMGGDYVAIDVAVQGIDPSAFRDLRRNFMKSLATQFGSNVFSNLVISVTRRG